MPEEYGQNKRCIQILHLEDNPLDAELIQSVLEGHDILCSINRVETRAAFETALLKKNVDVIFSDSQIPGMDTLQALTMVRECYSNIPFIFVSGSNSPRLKAEASMRGAFDFVNKDDLPKLARTLNWLFFFGPAA